MTTSSTGSVIGLVYVDSEVPHGENVIIKKRLGFDDIYHVASREDGAVSIIFKIVAEVEGRALAEVVKNYIESRE